MLLEVSLVILVSLTITDCSFLFQVKYASVICVILLSRHTHHFEDTWLVTSKIGRDTNAMSASSLTLGKTI